MVFDFGYIKKVLKCVVDEWVDYCLLLFVESDLFGLYCCDGGCYDDYISLEWCYFVGEICMVVFVDSIFELFGMVIIKVGVIFYLMDLICDLVFDNVIEVWVVLCE